MKISKKSTWTEGEIEVFLAAAKTPMRLAFNDRDGFPGVCSLWFYFDEGCFWAASHKNSHVIKMLKQSEKVSLEVATNEYPYKGVRGKANVELTMGNAPSVSTIKDRSTTPWSWRCYTVRRVHHHLCCCQFAPWGFC